MEVASAALAFGPSQRFQVAVHQLHDQLIVAWVAPAIAVDATDQHLTIVIDFHQLAAAVGADLIAHFESSPSLLSAARDIVIVGGISDEHEIVFGAVWVKERRFPMEPI